MNSSQIHMFNASNKPSTNKYNICNCDLTDY